MKEIKMSESGFTGLAGSTWFFKAKREIEYPDQGPADDHECVSSGDVKERNKGIANIVGVE